MKRISLETLIHSRQNLSYQEQYEYVCKLLQEEKIKPVKASRTNGKKPALYREYWILEEQKDYSVYIEELKYTLSTKISVDYYLAHPDIYEKERTWVVLLDEYLKNDSDRIKIPESLNVYRTTEPLPYYTHTRNVPQNLLILENKDPFFSMRNHLLSGHTEIFNIETGTLIYGAGKGIIRSFQDFDLCAEPYMKHPGNTILYFGDLDYEGIGIYENLAEKFKDQWKIIPFIPAYKAMLRKAESVKILPKTKESQNRNISSEFFAYFDEQTVCKMKKILEEDRYIPQEILNTTDF